MPPLPWTAILAIFTCIFFQTNLKIILSRLLLSLGVGAGGIRVCLRKQWADE